jgi:hypothetical protein
VQNLSELGAFVNQGILRKSAGTGTATISVPYQDAGGGVQEQKGQLTIGRRVGFLNGTLEADPGTTVVFADGVDQNGGSITGTSATFNVMGSWIATAGTIELSGTSLSISDSFDQSGGSMFVQAGSAVSVMGAAMLSGGSDTLRLGGTFTASGTFQQSAGSILVTDLGSVLTVPAGTTVSGGSWAIQHGGLVSDPGSLQQSGGSIAVQDSGSAITIGGAFTQSGGSALTAGSLSVTGSVVLSGSAILSIQQGSLTAGGGLLIQATAVLNGWGGTVYGDVTNAGTLNLIQDNTPTTLQINGNYTQTGVLNAGLGGENGGPGTQGNAGYSALWVSGLATLGGTFYFLSLNGFAPWPPENFDVLTYGSRQGTFDAMYLPPVSAGTWDVIYDDPQHRLTLWVVG